METEQIAMSKQQLLAEKLAANPDGVLERIAAECGVSTLDVVKALPEDYRTVVPGSLFSEIMADLETWGDVLVIVHTPDIVLECVSHSTRHHRPRLLQLARRQPHRRPYPLRELRRNCLRVAPLQRPALVLHPVLQWPGRGDVQGVRRAGTRSAICFRDKTEEV